MNRLAVVIAADSASTVTHWTDKGSEERYFKGANKIFQLSDYHPVGLMIFDSSDILRVPWELVVKAFRHELGKKSFNSLAEYAGEFFSFLEKSPRIFPPEIQKSVFLDNARAASLRATIRPESPGETDDDRIAENDRLVKARRTVVDALVLPDGIEQAHVETTVTQWRDDLTALIEEWRDDFGSDFPTNIGDFAELGILEVFKNPGRQMGTTGLVFAGYGDHDIFPAFCEYKSCGILAGKHVAMKEQEVAVTHETPAWLGSFAQTDMSDTFSMGVSRDVYTSVMTSVENGLEGFANDVATALGVDAPPSDKIKLLIAETRKEMGRKILDDARREHAIPMRRVLGVLPVDEMADLAETLINLQALKEKVTKKSETVGGPVDVAIITKNEGLLWVKRKHFFDIDLNFRFALRQQARLG